MRTQTKGISHDFIIAVDLRTQHNESSSTQAHVGTKKSYVDDDTNKITRKAQKSSECVAILKKGSISGEPANNRVVDLPLTDSSYLPIFDHWETQ